MKKRKSTLMLSAGILSAIFLTFGGASSVAFAAETDCPHEYREEIVASTCTEQGYTKYICELCGDSYKDNYIESKGHSFSEVIVPATCAEQGFTTHLCLECGYQYSDHYTDEIGHTYTDVIFEPTCIEGGYKVHTCETCKASYTDSFTEKLGHDYIEETLNATCTESGYTTYTCQRCGYSYIGDETEAKGHTYTENTVSATCVAYGFTEHICGDCNARYVTDYVKPLGHNYREEVVPATENQLGYTKHVCKTCGYTYLSDFSTSEDNGYIEVPVEPQPPVHTHSYTLTTTVDRTDKIITLDFVCDCGEEGVDLVTVLFTDKDGEITTVKPVDGTVSYAEMSGAFYTVTVVDDYGNVLKVFEIVSGEVSAPEEPDTPDNPDTPDKPEPPEHTHSFILYSQVSEADGYLTLNYTCDCGEVYGEALTVIFKDESGNERELPIGKDGQVDFSELVGTYEVSVKNAENEVLTVFEVKVGNQDIPDKPDKPDIPDQPEQPSDSDDDGNTKKGNSSVGVVLFAVLALLAVGGVATFIIIKKKNKK